MPSDFESEDDMRDEPCGLERDLLDAIHMRRVRQVADLLEQGVDIHCCAGHCRETPLHIAAQRDRPEIIPVLVGGGADVNRADTQGQSPLFYAADGGCLDSLQQLLALKADPNHAAFSGRTALFAAALKGRADIITALIDGGADPNHTVDGSSALFYATNNGHYDAVQALVRGGARVDIVNRNGETALKMAQRLPPDPRRREILAAFLEAAMIQDQAVNGLLTPIEPLKTLRFKPRS